MEINIEEKLPYTDTLIVLMRKSLKEKNSLTISCRLIEDIFEELGVGKYD